ncbi:NEK kinase, partial [Cardiosporidium cionae]
YVMKVINIERMSEKDKAFCINEVQVLAKLNHPFIVKYKESFIENMCLYIIMEYCEGGDLFSLIKAHAKAKKKFFEKEITQWLTQALIALRFLHKRHILHRDIKSMNLFLDNNGRLRIGDFGVSKVLENTLAYAQTMVGTPYYLSPELCEGSDYTWPSDIWSLGCVIYELASFETPFGKAKNIHQLMDKVKNYPVWHQLSHVNGFSAV